MLRSIKKMLDAFERDQIVYCHWKSNEHLSEALNGDTDLDVLFDPNQRVRLEIVLDECGLKRFRATPLMQYNAIEDFIGFDTDTAKIWHLHTHYRMTLGEKHLKGYTINPWGKLLLGNRRKDGLGIWCSAYEDELVLLLVRMALKLRFRDIGQAIGRDDKVEYEWLCQRVEKEIVAGRASLFVGEKAANEILRLLYEKTLLKKNQLRVLRRCLLNQLKYFTGYSRLGSRCTRTKRECFWLAGGIKRRLGVNNFLASRRVSPSGGSVIAFLGCDGAGKSTTMRFIKKELSKKLDVVSIYFGSGDGHSSLLRRPMKLVANRVGGKGLGHAVEKEYSSGTKISLKSRLYSFAKIVWAIALAQEKKRKIKNQTKARNNGLIVLTDRYPQTVYPGCCDGPLLSKYSKRKGLLARLAAWENDVYAAAAVNPPDLTIKLIVPTAIAINRKPEMTVEEIETKATIVTNLNLSENTRVIDTSRPFEDTRSEIMESIWEIL